MYVKKKMYKGKKISVIIAAAGSGKRMGGGCNKQYIDIGGVPVLARCLATFENCEAVDSIVVSVKPGEKGIFYEKVLGNGNDGAGDESVGEERDGVGKAGDRPDVRGAHDGRDGLDDRQSCGRAACENAARRLDEGCSTDDGAYEGACLDDRCARRGEPYEGQPDGRGAHDGRDGLDDRQSCGRAACENAARRLDEGCSTDDGAYEGACLDDRCARRGEPYEGQPDGRGAHDGRDGLDDEQSRGRAVTKLVSVVEGGSERYDSVAAALAAVPADTDIILVHDGARPLVSGDVVSRTIEACCEYGAAVPAVPVKDTVKVLRQEPAPAELSGRGRKAAQAAAPSPAAVSSSAATASRAFAPASRALGTDLRAPDADARALPTQAAPPLVSHTLDRGSLAAVQTPQAFDAALLRDAYDMLARGELDISPTDDASLIEACGHDVAVVAGDENNIKITTPPDVEHARRIILGENHMEKSYSRTGTGFDVHAFAAGRRLILGGVDIPYENGLLGHSDADVLVHAVMDALLGACALGDIGRHFPDSDPAYEGISSLVLLGHVKALLDTKGFDIINIDATVIAQAPKVSPYIEQMQKNLAEVLKISMSQINIKGTTTEKLGFTGRGEGIATMAAASVIKR